MFHRTSRNATLATSIALGLALGTLPAAAQAPANRFAGGRARAGEPDGRAIGQGRDSRGIGQEG